MLPDVLTHNLRVVFCGTAAGGKSAAVGYYYAGPGNKFWRTLHHVGLTPRQLQPQEFNLLPQFGIGLTDIAKSRCGADASLSATDFDTEGFVRKVSLYRPAWICFNGKKSASVFLGRPQVEFGMLCGSIAQSRLFVAPSTSGAANGYWDESHWQALANLCR